MTNRFNKISTLSMRIRKSKARTLLEDVHFTAPFKVAAPFYDAQDHMRVMIMSVSAGIMAGDRQEIDITVASGARAEIGSQSFEKIHKMEPGTCAKRHTSLHVSSGAMLIYSPFQRFPLQIPPLRVQQTLRLRMPPLSCFSAKSCPVDVPHAANALHTGTTKPSRVYVWTVRLSTRITACLIRCKPTWRVCASLKDLRTLRAFYACGIPPTQHCEFV